MASPPQSSADAQSAPRESASTLAENLFRAESGRIVAILTAHLGTRHLQLAQDVVQEALVRALQTWPYRGIPAEPIAWLTRTAKNLALDQLRREQNWNRKAESISQEHERWLAHPTGAEDEWEDATLRLLFVCFHPQLSEEAQIALALRTLGGLSADEIAAAFLTSESAISKRLVRTRKRIRDLALPFEIPAENDRADRLHGVLGTLYLLFNEGYKASSGKSLVRADLCHEAIRLATLLTHHSVTATPRTYALLALMLLNASRLESRADEMGKLLRLHEQDRSTWDQGMIAQGIQCLALAGQGDVVSEFHLEAGIAACHSIAPDENATDWRRILALYDQLMDLTRSPVVALNRAVALSKVEGPQAGLHALDGLALENYHLTHAVRGVLAADLGDNQAAAAHLHRAISLAEVDSEREFLQRKIAELAAD